MLCCFLTMMAWRDCAPYVLSAGMALLAVEAVISPDRVSTIFAGSDLAVSSPRHRALADNDDGGKANEAVVNVYYNDDQNPYGSYVEGDDYAKYWTEFTILPKKCIV